MWLGISELGLFHPLIFFFWSPKNLMGTHRVTDCRERVVCGGCGFQRLYGKAGRVPGAGRVISERWRSVRSMGIQSTELKALEGLEGHSPVAFKSTQKAGLLSSFTGAWLGGSGHLELGRMLHSSKHSEDFNPQHVLFMFYKAFS